MYKLIATKWRIKDLLRAARWEYRETGILGLSRRLLKWFLGVRRYHPMHRDSYRSWLLRNSPQPQELRVQRQTLHRFKLRPLFSFITPVFDPPQSVFEQMLESVACQTYDRWEICLVLAGKDKCISQLAQSYALRDRRFRIKPLDRNLGISGNSNSH